MRISGVLLISLTCAPLLGACTGLETYAERAESERPTCAQMEGYPDCVEERHSNLIAHERGVEHTNIGVTQTRYE
jgi:hypothetical protein